VEDGQMGEKIGTVVLKDYAQKHECPYKGRIAICIENNTKFQSAQLVLMMYQPITTKHKVIWDPPMYLINSAQCGRWQ